jgi:acetyltransferase-like isoleucine patch superfamily enzyme
LIGRIAIRLYRRILIALVWAVSGPHAMGAATRSAVEQVRANVVRASLGRCGARVTIHSPVCFHLPERINVGADVSIAPYVHIWGAGGVEIGDRVMIGTHTSISSVTHDHADAAMWTTVVLKPVVIADDVWIGSNAVIMPGVTVGRGAVIGAGAVVTKNVPEFSIAVGVPALPIAVRKMQEESIGASRDE